MDLRSQYTEKEVINYEALHGRFTVIRPGYNRYVLQLGLVKSP